MAHALRYYKELVQPDGTVIRLEIHKKDSISPALEIGRVVQALRLDIQGGADAIDTPIVKTSVTMTFVDAPDLEEGKKCGNWEEFYTPDSTMWKVILKANGNTIWGGYVTPDSYQEDLRYRGYVTIIARDNIGHLQDFPFDMEGNADGMVTLQEMVNAAWAKIESPMVLDWRHDEDDANYLLCNGVEAPQTYMNVSAFEEMSFYDAVEKSLFAYGLVMRFTGLNRVTISSLRDMPLQGKASAPNIFAPTFVAHAQRELAPATRRIEESVEYEITDVNQKLVKRADYRGGSIEVPDYSGFTARVYPLNNSTEGIGWMNPLSTDPIYFNPAAYNLAEVSYSFPYTNDEKQNLPNTMMLLCNNRRGEAVFSKYVSAIDCQFNIVFGGRYFVESSSSYDLLKQNQDYCRITAVKYSVRVKKNGITNYLQEDGQWTATEAVLTVSDSNLDQVTIAVPFKDTGYVLLELVIKTIEVNSTLANHYVAIQALRLGNISSNPMLERNNVNTIYDNGNNVIIDHSPELAPAFNDTAVPGIIKNGIFVKSGREYLPAKEWAWSGRTPQQMAVYNHLQLLCYHSKPNNIISGDIVGANFADTRVIYEWGDAYHILVSGSYNFINGRIESAVLREFQFYEDMWSDITGTEMPTTEQKNKTAAETGGTPNSSSYSNTTTVNIGGEGSGGSGSTTLAGLDDVRIASPSENDALVYDAGLGKWMNKALDTEISDTSENAVQNKIIKAYVDGKAKEAQAAAERYIQDEVLTAYATTRYVGEREEYLVGYAEELVNALEDDINGRGYLTSAAMGGYATKEEIANFISKSGGTVTGDLRIQGNITLLGEALFRAETPSGGTYPRFRMFQHTNGLFFQAASYDGTSVKGKIGFTGYGGSPAEDIQFIADSIRFVGTASFNGVQLGELAFKNTADIMAVGGTIGSNSNFNDYTTPGSYLVAGENMQNAPGGYGTLLVIRGIEDYVHSQLFVNANGTVKVRTESDGVKNWQPWRTLIDDANIATQLQNVGDSRYLKLTGGKITGSLEISADESIKASIPAGGTYSRYRFIQNNSALYFQVCKYDGIDRAGVLIISGISGIPAEKIQLNAQTLLFSGAATFQNSITLGNNTITSWDDFITSDGGTINAGKYLKFATSAYPVSLGVAATLDGYDKLVVSGLTQMSDLYITEKLYFEKGCTVTFRNWSTGEKETISSFSDLKGVLGLGGLAYKDEADVVKSASDFAASGNPNVIGYSYERNGWKGNGPAMLWGTDGYYTRLNVLTEDTDSPQMFISNVYANNAKGWAKVITDKNIGSYGLELIVASTHPEPTDRRAFATYAYQSYGWKTTGPALAFPDGTSKGLIQMGYDTDFVRMYIAGVKTEGVLSWTEVVTQETIGSMAMSIRSERLDASVDADDIINPGSYIVIGSTSFPVSHGVALTVAGTNTYFIGQLVLDGSGHIYSRLRWGEDWSDWNTVIDEGNIGDYALPKAGGTISGSLAVTGALAANGGIKLGDETINSWAEVRSNWGWRYTSLINQVGTIQIDIKIRQKTTIAETLTSAHRLVFNLITEANTNPEWLIVFTTGTTVPIIGIAKGSDSLYWQNNQNILNNLSPHTTYRIYIDSNLVMYDTFNVL